MLSLPNHSPSSWPARCAGFLLPSTRTWVAQPLPSPHPGAHAEPEEAGDDQVEARQPIFIFGRGFHHGAESCEAALREVRERQTLVAGRMPRSTGRPTRLLRASGRGIWPVAWRTALVSQAGGAARISRTFRTSVSAVNGFWRKGVPLRRRGCSRKVGSV